LISGCSYLEESAKIFMGTSTKGLNKTRAEAISQTYQCDFDSCFDVVLSLGVKYVGGKKYDDEESGSFFGGDEEEKEEEEIIESEYGDKSFTLFLKNRIRGEIVFMGIAGQVDTTEVGVFFDEWNADTINVEVASKSSLAKEQVALDVFARLDENFSKVK